ncbi:hypothetical protein [Curtobacterium sp. MCJR17_020]|uniref:hypothetical protein n=1 Tax=Curtobacterium sp. MCJR17_020 TaxID=2175619 RepID=UPI000DAAD1BF|nr:hypothetical protein [Curtobacterium sp. MCJR17_020]WIE71843.1 hypothetical protein DEJ14_016945 [Curtobacterium sp. MCJR17_020]
MIHEDFPDVLVVGPVADRSFSDDGRLVIDYGTAPRWSPDATLPDLVARAKLLALLLDALDPEVDVRVGARHQFLLNDHIDGRVDTRAGGTPPRLLAYGSLTTTVIRSSDLGRLVDVRNEPSMAQGLFTFPRGAEVVSQIGPGAALTRYGDTGYFDQVLSFETDNAASPSKQTTKALHRWTKIVDGWRKKATPAQRELEGPWI